MNFSREELVEVLSRAKVELIFIKIDGTERLMNCTLNKEIAGEDHFNNIKNKDSTKLPNPDTITCVDLDKNAWRSYRIESIKSFRVA